MLPFWAKWPLHHPIPTQNMWFETLTSLELDRLIEFEATHCLIVAAVKGARLIMYLRVPGFEKCSLFQIWERKCWRRSWCAMSCYRGWNYSKIALFLFFSPISDKFVETFKDELHESNKTLTHRISKQKIAHSLAKMTEFLYICLVFQVWRTCLQFCRDWIIFFRDCLILLSSPVDRHFARKTFRTQTNCT